MSGINIEHPFFKLAQAVEAMENDDPAVAERAGTKAQKWRQIIGGIFSGDITVGSRQPTSAPKWVTLDVMNGGFATGDFKAGGPFQEHELLLRERLGLSDKNLRENLNVYFLTEAGLAELNLANEEGSFEISTPEEGALLCVAFFLKNNQTAQASEILNVITPFFDRLRFFPRSCLPNKEQGFFVHRRNVGELIQALNRVETSTDILRQIETIRVWLPIYDACISHFISAFDLDFSCFEESKFTFAARLPEDTVFSESWREQLHALLNDFEHKKTEHTLCRKPYKRNAMLRQIFQLADDFRKSEFLYDFTFRCRLEHLLSCFLQKYGLPSASRHQAFRVQQRQQIDTLLYKEVARKLVKALQVLDMNNGIENVSAFGDVPNYFDRKLKLSLSAPIDVLIEKKVITSGDILAELYPQITSHILSGAIEDSTARRLYSDLYKAFRDRRSLLLLNYESQIRSTEVPWIRLLEKQKTESIAFSDAAREAMREVMYQNLQAFPYAIIPNKLLQEIEALSAGAGLDVPIVKEIAADIFMGNFNQTFLRAAEIAATHLKDSLYSQYYEIDFDEILSIADRKKPHRWPKNSRDSGAEYFSTICRTRSIGSGSGVAKNGTILEQQQILTTQNLMPLIVALDLGEACDWIALAQKTLKWVFARQQIKLNDRHSRMIMIKNTAYAWRQMLVYLSLAKSPEVDRFMIEMNTEFRKQKEDFQERFKPAWRGLIAVTQDGERNRGQLFTGWTTEKHFLFEENKDT